MITFIIGLAILIVGSILYGMLCEKVFRPDDRETPAVSKNDGIDYIPMPRWRNCLIQLLNIAGTGPILGPIQGILFGPIAFITIPIGCVIGGAMHDYMSAMISVRNGGAQMPSLVNKYLGKVPYIAFSIVVAPALLLAGTVFTYVPGDLIVSQFMPKSINPAVIWIVYGVIFAYYFLATLLPIDKIIARFYPVFGVILIVMAVGIVGGLIWGGYTIPEIALTNLHPDGLSPWPFMFVTVACGAISGFHATQSPMMAKCVTTEKVGRKVFYGAMLSESVIALVWAAAGVAFYGTTSLLQDAIASLGQSGVVYDISVNLLGKIGGVLAVIGVVVCPITSGDTAFRAARLSLAEWTGLDQTKISRRLLLSLPMFAVAGVMTQINFDVLWRYSAWSNQTLAMLSLWTATAYLIKNGKGRYASLLTALPAAFMTAVSVTYILVAPEGFRLSYAIGFPIGAVVAVLVFVFYLVKARRARHNAL